MPTANYDDFSSCFTILDRTIGPGNPTYIIAEAGVSHFGDLNLALELLNLASTSGADAFKIQLFDVEQLIAKSEPEWRERLRPRNLTFEEVSELKECCDKKGLAFLATAHDQSRIPWLKKLNVPAIKIGSGERNNLIFIEQLAELNLPIILSTGMYFESDIIETLNSLNSIKVKEVALLHCVTSYPAPDSDINLLAINRLQKVFSGPVGYSDHTPDHLAILSAVAKGANIIEKHITIHRNIPNAQDWKVSAGPEDFPKLISEIRRVESILGHGKKEAAPSEKEALVWATKSIVASHKMEAGQQLEVSDLSIKRPGKGTAPNRITEFIGKTLKRDVKADEFILFEDIE